MGVTLASWLQSLQALLPPGRALSRDPGAVLTRLLTTIAALLLSAQVRFEAHLAQFDPRRATSSLMDWERLLGLPDECTADVDLSISERQQLAFGKLTEVGGQSRAYFIDLASRYGEQNVKIYDGFRSMNCNDSCNDALFGERDRYVWRVRFDHPTANVRAMTCNDNCNTALQLFTRALAECPLNERKPAHTHLDFFYPAASDALLARLAQFVREDTLVLEI